MFPIRTPDQRLRVFVSSTLAELADERAAVARAISALRLTHRCCSSSVLDRIRLASYIHGWWP